MIKAIYAEPLTSCHHSPSCIVKNKTAMLRIILLLVSVVMIVSAMMIQTIAAAPNGLGDAEADHILPPTDVSTVTFLNNTHLS